MYYVFKADDKASWAEVQGEMPNFLELGKKWHWWSDAPLPISFPETTFRILDDILLDRYKTGSIFDLYSKRLIKLLHNSDVRCEYFQVNVVASNKQKRIYLQYYAFHLMETLAAIDYEKSELIDSQIFGKFDHKDIIRMELIEKLIKTQRPLVRDAERPSLLLMHQSLKDMLTAEGIIGCKYIPYQNYRDMSISDIFIHE